ncbi:glycosyltransferase family 39 protein [Candidatus Vampirococcus lugosii]|uniref:4-amino-4-deoxy-L-arabinose transferase or related glycosyltransferase of PMT family n=1 Tax=Candidatus Vampirococcus lugosii TaxID=2789015 RepID=A0ABS5QLE3_9BACT|nr:glycosyltransferase family 39 protein [Candidatus Vampirococcus lugosii]MBS8121809.1 4-amino-4-deoxy-L-arabinose transferase or related glycosyltransferase of PMT family [Candidatus Vampirococcus lugosii]
MKKKYYFILIGLFFLWGIFLRFYNLGGASFWIDEGYSSITSYYSLQNNFLPLLQSGRYDFSQYFFTLSQNLSFSIFGYSDLSARIPSFVFGILLMILSTLFAYELLKGHKYKYIGVLFISFLSYFSTWQIIWSREARFYELLALILLFGVYLLYKFEISKKGIYFLIFSIIAGIGSIYHPFLLSLFAIGGIYLIYFFVSKFIMSNYDKTIIKKNLKYIFMIFGGFLFYLSITSLFKYITNGGVDIGNIVPNTFDLPQNLKENYINFYNNLLLEELGILHIFFIFGSFYLAYIRKYFYLIIFLGTFLINFFVISQKGIMLHSRYMYHIFSIITIFGSYIFFIFISYLYDKSIGFKNKIYKILLYIFIIFLNFSLFYSFNINLLPKNVYYIDYTSPKPNFKSAYNFAKNNYPNTKIISGMPQLCVWYNIENKNICQYSMRVNLTGKKSANERLIQETNHNYTAIPYINNISQIGNNLFILDDLSLRMSINKEIIDYVLNNCNKIFEDIGNEKKYNYIGVWKCKN